MVRVQSIAVDLHIQIQFAEETLSLVSDQQSTRCRVAEYQKSRNSEYHLALGLKFHMATVLATVFQGCRKPRPK